MSPSLPPPVDRASSPPATPRAAAGRSARGGRTRATGPIEAWLMRGSLSRRLARLLSLSSAVMALCSIGAVLVPGALLESRRSQNETEEIARTLAVALQAPVAFDDPKAINETLQLLRARPEVQAAQVYDGQGRVIGQYGEPPPAGAWSADRRAPGRIHTRWPSLRTLAAGMAVEDAPIVVGNLTIGRVVIDNRLDDAIRALTALAALVLLGTIAGLGVALLYAQRLARRLAAPVSALAATSHRIAQDNDFSRRIDGEGPDEMGQAVAAFNKMLDEVQARDAALADTLRSLERRVEVRTAELALEKERAVAASRAKTAFLANMSHELRTPLNAVIGAAQLLQQADVAPQHAHLVDAVRHSGHLLLGLIENVLDISRIESGALRLDDVPFELTDVIDGALATAAVAARAKRIQLAGIVDPGLPAWRQGDPQRLRQVLLNLLGNAVKFTPHGEVVLEARRGDTPAELRLVVRDTGVGIDLDSGRDIFDPFVQADDSTTRRFGGTGLGLAISRQLVEAMGGRIEVSSAPGQGSRFELIVALPFASGTPGEAPRRGPGVPVGFYEPHEASARALEALLLRMGCRPVRCTDAEGLQQWLAPLAERPDEPYWLLVACDDDETLPLLESVAALVDPARIIGIDPQGASFEPDAARQMLGLTRTVIRPVLRSALASRMRAAPMPASAAALLDQANTDEGSGAEPADITRVLVVEDDPTNQMIVCSMLRNAGFGFVAATDGHEAMQLLRQHPVDLVLMDWQMPDMDGLEATRRIRAGAAGERARRVPIVALTANAFAEDRAACLTAGMNDFLTKPVLASRLVACIDRWAGRSLDHPAATIEACSPSTSSPPMALLAGGG